MTRLLRVPVLLLVLASVACSSGDGTDAPRAEGSAATAAARPSGDGDAELEEISDYRLGMPKVERWYQAQRNVLEAMRKDPSIAARLENDESEEEGGPSLDELEERYSSIPEVRAAIEAVGLEVREFGVITYSLVQASFAQAALQMGANRDSVLANTGIDPANLDFVRDNQAELQRLQAEIAALTPKDDEEEGGA